MAKENPFLGIYSGGLAKTTDDFDMEDKEDLLAPAVGLSQEAMQASPLNPAKNANQKGSSAMKAGLDALDEVFNAFKKNEKAFNPKGLSLVNK